MWWRFLTFCILVCLILFVVLSCIHGRPVLYLLFHRCCEEGIENDHAIFENFGNNFLRERLVGAEVIEVDNSSFVSQEEVDEIMDLMREKLYLNVHDPKSRLDILQYHNLDKETKTKSVEEFTNAKDIFNNNDVKNNSAEQVTEQPPITNTVLDRLIDESLITIDKNPTIRKKYNETTDMNDDLFNEDVTEETEYPDDTNVNFKLIIKRDTSTLNVTRAAKTVSTTKQHTTTKSTKDHKMTETTVTEPTSESSVDCKKEQDIVLQNETGPLADMGDSGESM